GGRLADRPEGPGRVGGWSARAPARHSRRAGDPPSAQISEERDRKEHKVKRLFFALFPLAAAACTDHSTGITTEASVRYLQPLSLSVAQRADITPGEGVEYDRLHCLSSYSVAALGMARRTL